MLDPSAKTTPLAWLFALWERAGYTACTPSMREKLAQSAVKLRRGCVAKSRALLEQGQERHAP